MNQMKNASFISLLSGDTATFAKNAQAKIANIVKELSAKGTKQSFIDDIKMRGYESLKADLLRLSNTQREKVSLSISRLRELYDIDYARNAAVNEKKVADYERKLSGLTKAELLKEAEKYRESGDGIDPRMVDALSAEIKFESPEDLQFLREAAQKKNYEAPYLASDEGKSLTNELSVLNSCVNHPGTFPAYVTDEKGQHLITASIEDLLFESEDSQAEDDNGI